jgi:hypothetical protein
MDDLELWPCFERRVVANDGEHVSRVQVRKHAVDDIVQGLLGTADQAWTYELCAHADSCHENPD